MPINTEALVDITLNRAKICVPDGANDSQPREFQAESLFEHGPRGDACPGVSKALLYDHRLWTAVAGSVVHRISRRPGSGRIVESIYEGCRGYLQCSNNAICS